MAGIKTLQDIGFINKVDYNIFVAKSHTSAIKGVLLKEFDCAITTYTPIKQLLDEKTKNEIRIIESSFAMPHLFILTNPNTNKIDYLKELLKEFENSQEGKKFFEKTGYKGYIEISNKDIKDMESLLDDTKKFLFQKD